MMSRVDKIEKWPKMTALGPMVSRGDWRRVSFFGPNNGTRHLCSMRENSVTTLFSCRDRL